MELKCVREGCKETARYVVDGNSYCEGDHQKLIKKREREEEERKRREEDCFVATACIEARGLSRDCLDLNILRIFRDEYIKKLPGGKLITRAYYKIGPKIVVAIDKTSNSKEIYSRLYDHLVLKSVEMIRAGRNRKAFIRSLKIMTGLCLKYLFKL